MGLGDVDVTTVYSRALSIILSIYGIFVVALLTSIIVNFYNEIKDEKKDDIKGSDEKPEDKEIADSDKE